MYSLRPTSPLLSRGNWSERKRVNKPFDHLATSGESHVSHTTGPGGRHITAHRFNGGEGPKKTRVPAGTAYVPLRPIRGCLNIVANGGAAKPALSLPKGAVRRGRQPALGEPSPSAAEPRILLYRPLRITARLRVRVRYVLLSTTIVLGSCDTAFPYVHIPDSNSSKGR